MKRIYKRPDYRQRATDVGPVWGLVHPHLSRVFEVYEDKFWIWIVEEVIDGVDILTTLDGTVYAVGRMTMKSTRRVLGHSLLRLLVRSQRSLIRLLRTARFARALHCAHSCTRSLTRSLRSS